MDFQFCQPKFGALPVLQEYPCICRNLRAFGGDQTDPKSVCGGPNTILSTGPDSPQKTVFKTPQTHATVLIFWGCFFIPVSV